MPNNFQTVATMACMKSLLMLFNLALWASGLAILCAGIWMQVELHKYLELNSEYSKSVPYVIVGTGVFILFVGTLACCCTVKGQSSLLYMYGAFLLIVLMMELAVAASTYAYKDTLASGFEQGLNETMQNYGPDSPEKSNDFDKMQSTLLCCGSHKYNDWYKLTPAQPIPQSCCKTPKCDTQDFTEIYTDGCYSKVVEFLTDNIGAVAGCALGVAIFPLLGAILSCCLASNVNKANYEQMS